MMSDSAKSVQETYAMKSICFGCGPSNEKGLRIRSFLRGEELRATWQAESHHQAFPGVLNGGIVGALLDCHGNWAASMHLMKARGADEPPCTVTSEFAVQLKRPCPVDGPIEIVARIVESPSIDRAVVEGELVAQGKVRATLRGTFVAVGPGHPAFHRW